MKKCGCSAGTCGCCEGVQILTPASTYNRPGLPALQYRVGTHAAFFETMRARLSTMTVETAGPDGRTPEWLRPLQGLTVRDAGDPAIAWLDAWATVADVLTFYQERIANEGFLRTATERRSVLELSRLISYKLRPGVASTAYLAYTIDPNQKDSVLIPAGAQSQSTPGQGELPQYFETSEPLEARAEWNNLQVRLTEPQDLTFDDAFTTSRIYLLDSVPSAKAGDTLLFEFPDSLEQHLIRRIKAVESDPVKKRTTLSLLQLQPDVHTGAAILNELIRELESQTDPSSLDSPLLKMIQLRSALYHGSAARPEEWPGILSSALNETDPDRIVRRFADRLRTRVGKISTQAQKPAVVSPDDFVPKLLIEPAPQPPNSLRLTRDLSQQFSPGADTNAQLLVNFAPRLKDTFYQAWSTANVNSAKPELKAVYVMRVAAPLFGATAPPMRTFVPVAGAELSDSGATNTTGANGRIKLLEDEWPVDEIPNALFLDQEYSEILPGTPAIIQTLGESNEVRHKVLSIKDVITTTRTAYGISGKSTCLTFETNWYGDQPYGSTAYGGFPADFGPLRKVLVYAQAEELPLAEKPVEDPLATNTVELDGLYNELKSGRWVVIAGERQDIEGVAGVNAAELLMISALRQSFNSELTGDKTHTTLVLSSAPVYGYKPETIKIYANVVKATNGQTRNETLGSGDGSQAFLSFALKQPPLTFVPASNPQGVDSTLKVYVNDIEWHEAATFVETGPKDRVFVTDTGDDDKVTITFGDGEHGARPPTGMENLRAVYRSGIGKGGNVQAGQINLPQTRQGVREVINPLAATGGADKETRDQARDNAPVGVTALDRLVSIQDYADFSRTFAGIAKAEAKRLSDGERELVHVTIAAMDDIPIDQTSDLYQNLLSALTQFGDAALAVRVELRELKALVLSAKIKLLAGYQWEPVVTVIRQGLLDKFGFSKRALGQPVFLSEVISMMQNVAGVDYIDVDAFGAVPEKKADPDGTRRLVTLSEIADAVASAAGRTDPKNIASTNARTAQGRARANQPGLAQWVTADLADFEDGVIRPAQLAIMTDAVPDAVTLNQIV
jgi:hypothetical protein